MKKYIMVMLAIGLVSTIGFAQDLKPTGTVIKPSKAETPVNELKIRHVSDQLNNPEFLNKIAPMAEKARSQKSLRKVSNDSVGDTLNFFVSNSVTGNFDSKAFKLVAKGDISQIWFELAELNNDHLDQAVADTMLLYLESKSNSDSWNQNMGVIALGNEIFGDAPDFDGDEMVDVLVTDIKDGFIPGESPSFIAGFFYSVDQLIDEDAQSVGARSNERDIIYIDSYPLIYNGSTTNPLRPLGTLIHEYQHLIHYNYNTRVGSNEYTFINEAQSMFAETAGGFYAKNGGGEPSNYFANTNVGLYLWERNREDGGVLKDYDRGLVWATYMWDRLGFENAKWLTQSSLVGNGGIDEALDKSGYPDLTYRDMIANWAVANYVKDSVGLNNRFYDYAHPFAESWEAGPNEVSESPDYFGVINVRFGGVYYLTFEAISSINVKVNFPTSGRVYAYQRGENGVALDELSPGDSLNYIFDQTLDEFTLIMVNTTAVNESNGGTNFTVHTSGVQEFTTATLTSTDEDLVFYWNMPSGTLFGFGNKYTVPSEEQAQITDVGYYVYSQSQGSGVIGTPTLVIGLYNAVDTINSNAAIDSVVLSGPGLTLDAMSFIDVSDRNWFVSGDFYIGMYIIRTFSTHTISFLSDDGNNNTGRSYGIYQNRVWKTIDRFLTDRDNSYTNWLQNVILAFGQSVSIYENGELIPEDITLYQNYPNPFNPSTSIRFSVPPNLNGENVSLKVYNTLGQVVRQLYSGPATAGSNVFSWNGFTDSGSQAGSGLYFYVLKTNSQTLSKSMILLK